MTGPREVTVDVDDTALLTQLRRLSALSRGQRLHKAVRNASALLDAADELLSGRGYEAEDRRASAVAVGLVEEAVRGVSVVLEAFAGDDGDGDTGGDEQVGDGAVDAGDREPDEGSAAGDVEGDVEQCADVVVADAGEVVTDAVVDEGGHAAESHAGDGGDAR